MVELLLIVGLLILGVFLLGRLMRGRERGTGASDASPWWTFGLLGLGMRDADETVESRFDGQSSDVAMNASGSPDERDAANDEEEASDGGGDDGGGGDGGGDD